MLQHRFLALTAMLSLFQSVGAFAGGTATSREQVWAHFRKSGFSGVSAVATVDGVFQAGFGRERNRAISPTDHFLIGSISKQFAAAAILKLAENGKLGVHQSVSAFIPAFPYSSITLHHLLSHTSGLSDVVFTPEFVALKKQPFSGWDPVIDLIVKAPVLFAPGERWQYSNTNYLLLTRIIEIASGEPWWDFVKRELADPAGLRSTEYGMGRGSALVTGHLFDRDYRLDDLDSDAYMERVWAGGAGGIESTVEDLERWNLALFSGGILNARSIQLMTAPYTATPEGLAYGYGLFIGVDTDTGELFYQHTGGIPGFTSYNAFYPSRSLTVVSLSNYMSVESMELGRALGRLEILGSTRLDRYIDNDQIVAFPTAPFVGEFTSDLGVGTIKISEENGHLYALFPGAPHAYRLVVRDLGRFYERARGGELRFGSSHDEFDLVVRGTPVHFHRVNSPTSVRGFFSALWPR